MNKWEPEPNAHIARRVGKTGEEAGELGSVCARIGIQGLAAIDPSSGKTNRLRLLEKMADVQAQINCNLGTILTVDEFRHFQQRTISKMAQMSEWEAHYRGAQPAAGAVPALKFRVHKDPATGSLYGSLDAPPTAQPAPQGEDAP